MSDEEPSLNQKPSPQKEDEARNRAREMKLAASLSFQVGCLTVIVAGVALAVGLWLDARFGTVPRWTLIFVLGSVPISMGAIFFLARRAIRSRRADTPPPEETGQE
jgi:F0F1-type ATP synthase assembly protein I